MSNIKLHGNISKGIYFKTRKEAERFIESMSEISDTYGFIFCADVLDYFLEDCNVNHDRYGWFDTSRWSVHFVGNCTPYIDHSYRVQLSEPIHYSDGSRLKPKETGPAWDGFRAGVEEAEYDIHGGLTTTSVIYEANKIKENYEEWLKKNPYTDITTLYPETHFVLPRSFGKVAFTKAWLNAMYGTPIYSIKNVIFNDPATIVFWTDGTKTVVKTQEGEIFDPEKGLAMAISKKALGNNREYYHTFLHWLKEYDRKYYWKDREYSKEYDRKYYWKDKEYSKKYNPVQLAYDILVKCRDHKVNFDIDDIIGYLGEALED